MQRLSVVMVVMCATWLSAQTPTAPSKPPQVNPPVAKAAHTFALGTDDFLLDGKPMQMMSCEMHPARIPAEYWRHRIQMAKAMGCNTVAAYIFWNYHEPTEGAFDFTTGNRDLAKFFKIA